MNKAIFRRLFLKTTVLSGAVVFGYRNRLYANSQAQQGAGDATINHEMDIVSLRFAPNSLTVKPGDTVTWTNRDIVPHTATAVDGSWDTGDLGINEKATLLVTDELVTSYYCRFHPTMQAQLIVHRG